jgi:hypothetical protein
LPLCGNCFRSFVAQNSTLGLISPPSGGAAGSCARVYAYVYAKKGILKLTGFGSRRDRRPRFGELVQFDGSHHDWFEGRGRKCCLMNMAGDAAGKTLFMLFEEETTLFTRTGS